MKPNLKLKSRVNDRNNCRSQFKLTVSTSCAVFERAEVMPGALSKKGALRTEQNS
ncbi:hypothetical protein CCACVL1_13452 [Corchorus capsularis]|uniref:Uncharacterized protein n=1 Tax=Corchorus capsularis TaxID=210143 RepID=A0A1R3IB11_COCAP|nr:hypothetical protein CCACVL1_13452 [Corchorus capsularis]